MLTESIKSTVHNILYDAGYNPTDITHQEFKRTTTDLGAWVETQNYYVQLSAAEWWYNKPVKKGDDIMIFGDYSPEGLDKLRQVVKIDPTESE